MSLPNISYVLLLLLFFCLLSFNLGTQVWHYDYNLLLSVLIINNLQSVKIFLFHTDLDSTEGSFKNAFDHLISIFGTRLGGSGLRFLGPA